MTIGPSVIHSKIMCNKHKDQQVLCICIDQMTKVHYCRKKVFIYSTSVLCYIANIAILDCIDKKYQWLSSPMSVHILLEMLTQQQPYFKKKTTKPFSPK
jgi:hypothetical protein